MRDSSSVNVAPSQVRELKRAKADLQMQRLGSHLHRCVN